MPAKAQWLLRVPEILAELSLLDLPVVDRAVCERLFRLRRRRAIDLIRCFGGGQTGPVGATAVEPETLCQRLPDLPAGVSLSAGALHIQFQSPEELLSQLFALAQAIANDYEAFEKRTSGV